MLMLQGDAMRLFRAIRAIRAAVTAFNHSLFEPQCSNATDSEAQSFACAEELEHAASDYSTDCNNSSAITREMPLSDESKQWIAKDTCSGRDALIHSAVALIRKNGLHDDADVLVRYLNEQSNVVNTELTLPLHSVNIRCSSAPTPTAEPQASATPTDTPTVKREYV